jgi:hypothetical protein
MMHNSGFQMCASEALSGGGIYSTQKKYNMFHLCLNENFTKLFFLKYCGEYNASLPGIFNLDLISKHNFIVHSSTIFERKLYDLVGGYMNVQNGEEDYRLWLEMLKHTQCLYLNVPLLYYDARLPEPSILDFIRYIKLRLFNSFKKYQ